MPDNIIYIASDNRSGSTLLDQLLGAHQQVLSLGEVLNLGAYVLEDRRLYDPVHPLVCSCGERIAECPFWHGAESSLGEPLESLVLNPRVFDLQAESGVLEQQLNRIIRSILWRKPNALRSELIANMAGLKQTGRDSFRLFDAIFETNTCDYLVDSSKSAFRMRALHNEDPERLKIIVLCRDYRAVAYSKMKRGVTLQAAVEGWANRMRHIRELVSDISEQQKIFVRYEELCTDPEIQLARICEFLGVPYSPDLLSRATSDVHHLGGSPSKFDSAKRNIRFDDSFLKALSRMQLSEMAKIASTESAWWSYRK